MQTQSSIRSINFNTYKSNNDAQTNNSPIHVNISLTSDRIPLFHAYHQQFANAITSKNTTQATKIRDEVTQHLQEKIMQLIPASERRISHILGIWDSGFEQSFQVIFPNMTNQILHAMVKISQHFDQDAVHFIRSVKEHEVTRHIGIADKKGNVFTNLWEFSLTAPLPLAEFQSIIKQAGLMGAQLSNDHKTITIYNAYNTHQAKNKKEAKRATQEWEIKATEFAFIIQQKGIKKATIGFAEFKSYGRNEDVATRTYAQLDSDVSISNKQYKKKIIPTTKQAA